ncbi:hypothetical protein BD560DRAFT_396743 [Blakeslea trispora]|nr:hypothetical protein BD560DRAFT_396743 [Blakeslea trispora]
MKLSITLYLFLIITTVFAQQKGDSANKDLANTDDSSLFRGVENAIDESTEEDDAYRILKSLQDVTDEGEDDSDDDEPDSSSYRGLNKHDNDDNDDDDDDDDNDDDDEEDEDFASSLEFQNEETAEFFKNLPQQSNKKGQLQHEIEQKIEIVDQEEEIEDDQTNEPTEEEDEEVEEQIKQEEENIAMDESSPLQENQQFIPWKRPDYLSKQGNTDFYQDINFRETPSTHSNSSRFKFWHFLCIVVILMVVYYNTRKPSNNMTELSNTGAMSWHNEKEYLPSHNYNKHL